MEINKNEKSPLSGQKNFSSSRLPRIYVAIDLKSFYASVECIERGLDPLTTNLVVADSSRTQKTICLAVTPALKARGIPGRARLFEVEQKVKEINAQRLTNSPDKLFTGKSYDDTELNNNASLELDYITAPPRMAFYIDYSTKIYNIYLKYISAEDIHVYSIDEVFMDVTDYLKTYKMTAREFTCMVLRDVVANTGITATAGIGTNLYLCKIALDITAKHAEPDENGARIAELDEMTYRKLLWNHRPLTDFWRIGKGYARKLEAHGMYTMGDVAKASIGEDTDYYNEDLLYKLFGINAELLIDHAWGWEPCTIKEIKSYKPQTNSLSSGQVLHCPYTAERAGLVVREMADLLAYDLVEKAAVTNQLVITVGYDVDNLTDPEISSKYKGEIVVDGYGRRVPKHAHGTINLTKHTSSAKAILGATNQIYNRIVDKNLLVRRLTICANNVISELEAIENSKYTRYDLFTDTQEQEARLAAEEKAALREKNMQKAIIGLKRKYGKNVVLRGMNLEEGATAKDRNSQIGGHKA